jgi:hypothetical protein
MKDDAFRKEVATKFESKLHVLSRPRAPVVYLYSPCICRIGGRTREGYSVFSITYNGTLYKAYGHVLSYMLYRGPVTDDQVNHLCQHEFCVNHEHLVIGNAEVNAIHSTLNRQGVPKHLKTRNTSTDEVREIRRLEFEENWPTHALAEKFDKHPSTIRAIVTRKTFKHVY